MTTQIRLVVKPGILAPVVKLSGEIDLSNVDSLLNGISEAVPNSALGVVLDISEVTYIDSSGIRLLFDLDRRVRTRHQRLGLVVPDDAQIFRILQMTGVTGEIQIYDTAEQGARKLAQDPPL